MIQFTEKEINYQLDWEWDIQKTVFEEDNNGQYHYGSTNHIHKSRKVDVKKVERASKARINFDPNLNVDYLKVILLSVDDHVDYNAVRAFSVNHANINEYYPAHTRYEGEDKNGNHLVEFVVKEETQFPLTKNNKVTLEYQLHPDADSNDNLYAFFLTKGIGDVLKMEMVIEPGMNTEVQVNNQDSFELAFSTPEEGEEFLKGKMGDLANSIQNEI